MKRAFLNALAWTLTRAEEVIVTAWGWIGALEHQQHLRDITLRSLEQIADEAPGDYTVTASEQTVFEITKHHHADNVVHIPRKRFN